MNLKSKYLFISSINVKPSKATEAHAALASHQASHAAGGDGTIKYATYGVFAGDLGRVVQLAPAESLAELDGWEAICDLPNSTNKGAELGEGVASMESSIVQLAEGQSRLSNSNSVPKFIYHVEVEFDPESVDTFKQALDSLAKNHDQDYSLYAPYVGAANTVHMFAPFDDFADLAKWQAQFVTDPDGSQAFNASVRAARSNILQLSSDTSNL